MNPEATCTMTTSNVLINNGNTMSIILKGGLVIQYDISCLFQLSNDVGDSASKCVVAEWLSCSIGLISLLRKLNIPTELSCNSIVRVFQKSR